MNLDFFGSQSTRSIMRWIRKMTEWMDINSLPGVDGDYLVEFNNGKIGIVSFGLNENMRLHWLDYKGLILDKQIVRWSYLEHLRHKKDKHRITI
jgi:hypothetical protein